ncbi:MAG: efflux RND transporter permease subunit, partial [Myxococcota bacterium]
MSGFDITRWTLEKRVVAGAVFALFALAGTITYFQLPRAEDPGFIVRQAVIVTEFPGASAERVEELVTDPLEEGLQKLVGLDFINSISQAGQSVIFVAAQETLDDVGNFWDEMRERVGDQAPSLPREVIGPFINDDFGDVFGTLLAVTGDGFNLAELEDIADDLRRKFLQLPDVGKVELIGLPARRIWLEYDEARLAELGIGAEQIASALQGQNILSPSGRVLAADRVFEVQAEGSFRSLRELASTLIRVNDRAFPLEELVRIRQGYADDPAAPSMSFTGRTAVGIAISMVPGGKLTELGPQVRALSEKLTEDLPVGIELHLASYQTAVVETAVNNFANNLLQSVFIVLAVMLVALGLRTGLIVGAMVPMTILTTFAIMGLLDIGINKMSLTALIISLGLLVDNGIVMSESILVRRNRGEPLAKAAIDTARELKVPLLISSITTVAALLPTYLAESTTGEYTAPIAEVVAIALLGSWVISLTFIPLACTLFMGQAPSPSARSSNSTDNTSRYRSLLQVLIRYRWVSLVVFVMVLVGSGTLMQYVPQQFFPGKPWPQLTIELELPQGTPRSKTNAVVNDVERFFQKTLVADGWSEQEATDKVAGDVARSGNMGLVSWSAFVGEGAPRFVLGYAPEQPKENYAYFIVNVENYATIEAVIDSIEQYIADRFPEALTRVLPLRNGPPLQYPVEIRLSGDNIAELRRIVTQTEAKLRATPGLVRVGNDWGPDRPRVTVDVDPIRLRAADLTNIDVARSLDTAFRGRVLSVFRDGKDIVPIELRRLGSTEASVDDLTSVSVYRRQGTSVPLLQV